MVSDHAIIHMHPTKGPFPDQSKSMMKPPPPPDPMGQHPDGLGPPGPGMHGAPQGKPTVSDVWKIFTETTTSHGIPHVTRAQGPVKKAFWGTMLLCTLGLLLFNVSSISMQFFSRPVTVNIKLLHETELTFPAITVCNMNPVRKSAWEAAIVQQSGLGTAAKRKKRALTQECPDGFSTYNGYCYNITKGDMSFNDAQSSCSSSGGEIMSVLTSSEQLFLNTLYTEPNGTLWLGMGFQWVWVNGKSLQDTNYTFWHTLNPSGDGYCVNANPNGLWNDRSCGGLLPYICKKAVNPDGSCDPGAIYHNESNNCFLLYNTTLKEDFPLAVDSCRSQNAELMSVESPAEQQFVTDMAANGTLLGNIRFWIGLELVRYWWDNNNITYTNWGDREPNNSLHECVVMDLEDGKWYTRDCNDMANGFVCKKVEEPPTTVYSGTSIEPTTEFSTLAATTEQTTEIDTTIITSEETTLEDKTTTPAIGTTESLTTETTAEPTTTKITTVPVVLSTAPSTSVVTSEPIKVTTLAPVNDLPESSAATVVSTLTTTIIPDTTTQPTTAQPTTSASGSAQIDPDQPTCCCTCCYYNTDGTPKSCAPCGAGCLSNSLASLYNASATPAPAPAEPQSVPGSNVPGRVQTRESFQKTEIVTEALAEMPSADKEKLGYQANDFIVDCQFSGADCSVDHFQKFYNPVHGNCFIFNSGWNESEQTRDSYKTGRRHGLQLVLNIDQDEYIKETGDTAGARLVVHSQKSMPFPEDEGITVPPGQSTSVGVRQLMINRLGRPYGECLDIEEKNSTRNSYEKVYPVQYRPAACAKTCYQYNVVSDCNCSDPYYPVDENTAVCKTNNVSQDDCRYLVFQKFKENKLSCDCPNACNETIFALSASTAEWPADVQKANMLTKFYSKTPTLFEDPADPEKYKRNLLKVEVFYEEFNFELMQEKPAYYDGNYLSDLGGVLGLWLGCSALTIIEFIEFVMDMIAVAIMNKGCKKSGPGRSGAKKITVAPSPTPQDYSNISGMGQGYGNNYYNPNIPKNDYPGFPPGFQSYMQEDQMQDPADRKGSGNSSRRSDSGLQSKRSSSLNSLNI